MEEQKKYFHSGVVIENNVFETFDQPILYAKSVDSLVFKHNTITKNEEFKPFHWNTYPFFFERVRNVIISDNHFDEPLQETDVMTTLSEDGAVKF